MIYYESESGSIALLHYGVKGMKWREPGQRGRRTERVDTKAERSQIQDQEQRIAAVENLARRLRTRSAKMSDLMTKTIKQAKKSARRRKRKLSDYRKNANLP